MIAQDRKASRLIVADTQFHVLLFQYDDHRGKWWATPGGGLEASEAFEDAALREAKEELGLTLAGLMPPLWESRVEFESKGTLLRQTERFFLVRVDERQASQVVDTRQAHITEGILTARWWSLDQLRATSERVFPEDLAVRLEHLFFEAKH